MKSPYARGLVLLAAWLALAPRPVPALDLAGAFREVAAANPSLASRRERVEAARQRVAPAGAWQNPMVELGALNVPAGGGFGTDPMTMRMVALEQRVPVSGANRLSRRSASAAEQAEGAGLEMAGYELFAGAWEAYADAYFAGELARSSAAHEDEMDRLVRTARSRYESGGGRLDDLLRAEAERSRTLADLSTYEAEAAGARAELAALMGRDGAALADTLAAPPAPALPDDASPLLAALSASHPRLRELGAQAEHYRLAARAARRMAWPDLRLGVSYGMREPIAGMAQDNLWSGTLGLMLPLFAGQRELAEGSEMDALARASDADLRAAALDLDRQVRALHATALADRRRATLLADTVVVTQQRAVDASWSSYQAGAADMWRVFDATHALYEDDVELVRARQELARDGARLLALTARADLLGLSLPETKRSPR